MITLLTDQPSIGKTITFHHSNLPDYWVTVLEVPIFSIPAVSANPAVEDINYVGRELISGEVMITAPLLITNKIPYDFNAATFGGNPPTAIETRLLLGSDSLDPTDPTEIIAIAPSLYVARGETVQLPFQGLTLKTEHLQKTYGVRLQVKAGDLNTLSLYGTGIESSSADHAPAEV